MRAIWKLTVFAVGVAIMTPSIAAAQAPAQPSGPYSFQVKPEAARPLSLAATGLLARPIEAPQSQLEGGFGLTPAAAMAGDARILDVDRYYDGAGPVMWRSTAVAYQSEAGGPISQVRVSMAGVPRTATVAPLTLVRPDSDAYELRDVDVTLTRGWPSAVMLKGRKYALDVTPHAGVGFGGAGGSAEAGATVRLGPKKNMGDRVTDALGVREGGAAFGDRGRWYIYAAASGRAVGFNMLRSQNGDWTRAGLSQDVTSRLIGDSQAGVAWRKGPMQASFGYIHREIRAKEGVLGLATQKDDVVALSFSLKPHW